MQSLSSVVRPVASRCVVRGNTSSSYSRSIHSAPSTRANSSSASSTSSSSSTPSSNNYSLYVWGGGQSWLKSMTSSSASKKSPLTTRYLRPTEVQSPDQSGFRDISFGHKHAAFVTGSGELYTFGVGPALGHGEGVERVDTPRLVEGLPRIKEVKCGAQHTIALSEDGEVFTFGKGSDSFLSLFGTPSALGFEDGKDRTRPERVPFTGVTTDKIVQIAAGSTHNMIRTEKGQLFGWGSGENGRLGLGASSNQRTPQLVSALADKFITHISCGSSFNGAVTQEGYVYMFGRNEQNQLGLGSGLTLDQYSMESVPVRVHIGEDQPPIKVSKLSCAYKHTLAITPDGQLWTWGQRKWVSPNHMRGDEGWMMKERFLDCAGGQNFSAAVQEGGYLITWGDGASGCLGHGSTAEIKNPQPVRGFGPTAEDAGADENMPYLGKVVRVLAGHNHCAALTTKD